MAGLVVPYPHTANSHFARLRGGFATVLLALLVLAQDFGSMRDRQQQQMIFELQKQLQLHEQQLLQAKEQVASDHRQLTDAFWRQLQFVMNILADQLEHE